MTADSLNASPYKKIADVSESPINERLSMKEDHEKESTCERLSQVSPFLISPTTDTSAPENSDNFDNATGVSTLSKTTLPTDAKLSKPTECLSKATSIDSWCSNDTLYNVEENFDDMAVEPEPSSEPENKMCEKEEGNSESTDTLTHNEDDKELSHCSTYIIHDSKSEPHETFSPDSMTANGNNTYTKAKTEAASVTPSTVKSESRNSPTKDLAYGTLLSEMPSYSNCTTEAASFLDDLWKLPQPEMVRRSPIVDEHIMTPPKITQLKEIITAEHDSPLTAVALVNKMDSVEISFLQNNSEQHSQSESSGSQDKEVSSPVGNFMEDMMPSITSTPLAEINESDDVQPIPMQLPETKESPESIPNVPNFQMFLQSAEVRPQDLSSDTNNQSAKSEFSEVLLEGDTKTLSGNSNRNSLMMSQWTPTYSDFENSAITKPQENTMVDWSGRSIESGMSSEGFRRFEISARNVPQDLSSVIDATSWLLRSERMSSDPVTHVVANSSSVHVRACSSNINERDVTDEDSKQSLPINPPNITNLTESQNLVSFRNINNPYLINFDIDEEMDQPHSIIITETSLEHFKETPQESYESHAGTKYLDLNSTYDSHASRSQPKLNGEAINTDSKQSLKSDDNGEGTENTMLIIDTPNETSPDILKAVAVEHNQTQNGSIGRDKSADTTQCNGSQKYAVVNFLSETFEELLESNVDDGDIKDLKLDEYDDDFSDSKQPLEFEELMETPIENPPKSIKEEMDAKEERVSNGSEIESAKITTVTEDFLQNEKKFCTFDSYFPMLSDIRFTGEFLFVLLIVQFIFKSIDH